MTPLRSWPANLCVRADSARRPRHAEQIVIDEGLGAPIVGVSHAFTVTGVSPDGDTVAVGSVRWIVAGHDDRVHRQCWGPRSSPRRHRANRSDGRRVAQRTAGPSRSGLTSSAPCCTRPGRPGSSGSGRRSGIRAPGWIPPRPDSSPFSTTERDRSRAAHTLARGIRRATGWRWTRGSRDQRDGRAVADGQRRAGGCVVRHRLAPVEPYVGQPAAKRHRPSNVRRRLSGREGNVYGDTLRPCRAGRARR